MAWSVLQSASSGPGFGTRSATYTASLTSGTKLIAVALTQNSGFTTTGVADAAANAFTKILAQSLGGTRGELSLWARDTPAGDAGTKPAITATASAGTNTYIFIQEVSGLATGSTVLAMCDGTPAGINGATTGSGGTITSPAYSSVTSGEYLLSCITTGDLVFTAPGNLTADPHNLAAAGGNFGLGAGYSNSTGGTESGAWTYALGTADRYASILVAFNLTAVTDLPAAIRPFGASRGRQSGTRPVRSAVYAR